MSSLIFRFFALLLCLFLSLSAFGVFNLKTKEEGFPKAIEKKHWILTAQGCGSCEELLAELKSFCGGKKPLPSQLGFLAAGSSISKLSKKLEGFAADYEIFAGSHNEFFEAYKISSSPSLRVKESGKLFSGKNKIIKFLKKDSSFCGA